MNRLVAPVLCTFISESRLEVFLSFFLFFFFFFKKNVEITSFASNASISLLYFFILVKNCLQ